MGDSDPKVDRLDTPTQRDETTANNKERLLWALQETRGLIYKACKLVNIVPQTYYNYLKDDSEFSEAVKTVINSSVDDVEQGLLDLIDSKKEGIRLGAIKIYLDAKGKDRGYGTERRQQEHSGEIGVKGQVTIVKLPRNNREPG